MLVVHEALKTLCLILQDIWDKMFSFFSNVAKKTLCSLDKNNKNKHFGFTNILTHKSLLMTRIYIIWDSKSCTCLHDPSNKRTHDQNCILISSAYIFKIITFYYKKIIFIAKCVIYFEGVTLVTTVDVKLKQVTFMKDSNLTKLHIYVFP